MHTSRIGRQLDHVRAATIVDVARRAGVAASSVSRVFNGHPDVSPTMRARVHRAAEELGYQPDPIAQSLRRGTSKTVGFVVRDISSPLFADIAYGTELELSTRGFMVLSTGSAGSAGSQTEAARILALQSRRVDGLIISLESESNADTNAVLESLKVPFVLVDREVHHVAASAVISDHFHGVLDATRHLLDLGHRSIALITGPEDIRASRERIRGFLAAHEGVVEASMDLVRSGPYTFEFGHEQAASVLDDSRATAVIGAGYFPFHGCLAAVAERDLELGRDISLIACDEVPLMRFTTPAISTVARDARQLGATAARILVEQIVDGARRQLTETLPTEFISRESTGPPAS